MNIVYSTLGWLDIAVACFPLLSQIGLKEVPKIFLGFASVNSRLRRLPVVCIEDANSAAKTHKPTNQLFSKW